MTFPVAAQTRLVDSFVNASLSGHTEDSAHIYTVFSGSNNNYIVARIEKGGSAVSRTEISGMANTSVSILNNQYLILLQTQGSIYYNWYDHRFHCYRLRDMKKVLTSSWYSSASSQVYVDYWNHELIFSIKEAERSVIRNFDLISGQEKDRVSMPNSISFLNRFGNRVAVGYRDSTGEYLLLLDNRLRHANDDTIPCSKSSYGLSTGYETDSNVLIRYCRDSFSGAAILCIPGFIRFGKSDLVSDVLLNNQNLSYVNRINGVHVFSDRSGYYQLNSGILSPIDMDVDGDGNANKIEFLDKSRFFRYFRPITGWNYGVLEPTGKLKAFELKGNFDYRDRDYSPARVQNDRLFLHKPYNDGVSGLHLFDADGMTTFIPDQIKVDPYSPFHVLIPQDSILWFLCYSLRNRSRNYLLLRYTLSSEKDTTLRPFVWSDTIKNRPVWFRNPVWVHSDGNRYPENMNQHIDNIYLDRNHAVIGVVATNAVKNFASFAGTGENKVFYGMGSDVAFKYSADGRLQWAGIFSDVMFRQVASAFDGDSTLWISATANGKFSYAGQELFGGQNGLAVLKINAHTGKLMWSELLNPGAGVTELEVDKMTVNGRGEVYIAMVVRNLSFVTRVGSVNINTTVSPANILIKLSPDGQVIWGRSIETPWRNKAGTTTVLAFDKNSSNLTVIQSQGFFNVWSSCRYMRWGYYHQVLNERGDLIKILDFSSSDLGAITSGTYNNQSGMIVQGYFRGTLNFGPESFNSPPDRNCNREASFRYMTGQEDPSGYISKPDEEPEFSFNMLNGGTYLYSLCVNQKKELYMLKHTQAGRPIAKLDLRQKVDIWQYYRPANFAVNDSFIALGFAQFNIDSAFITTAAPFRLENYASIGVLKIRNEGWEYFPEEMESKEQGDFSISPNPVSGEIFVTMPAGHEFSKYRVYEVGGKLLSEGSLNTSSMYAGISSANLGSGVYILELSGPSVSRSRKFVKM